MVCKGCWAGLSVCENEIFFLFYGCGFFIEFLHWFLAWSSLFEEGWLCLLGAVNSGEDRLASIVARDFLVDVGKWWMTRLRFRLFLIFMT